MSSKGRGQEAHPLGDYPTPGWCVERLLEVWAPWADPWLGGGGAPAARFARANGALLLEPCAGTGGILTTIGRWEHARGLCSRWCAVELQAEHAARIPRAIGVEVHAEDFLLAGPWWGQRFDAVVSNPPYDLAFEFLEASLRLSPRVAFLLRLGFLASASRAEFMRANPPDVYVVPDRPRFDPSLRQRIKPDGTWGPWARSTADSADYAWLVWHGPELRKARAEVRVLATTPAEVRAATFAAACETWDAAHPEIVAEWEAQKAAARAASPDCAAAEEGGGDGVVSAGV